MLPTASADDEPKDPKRSSVRCFGENPSGEFPGREKLRRTDKDFLHHTCMYQNVCFRSKTDSWVLYAGTDHPESSPAGSVIPVALGAPNPRWSFKPDGVPRIRFQPEVLPGHVPESQDGFRWAEDVPELVQYVNTTTKSGAAATPGNVTWVLWHSLASHNFGHMLWDDLLPLFYLGKLLGFEWGAAEVDGSNNKGVRYPLLARPLRYTFHLDESKDEEYLWASCQFSQGKAPLQPKCEAMLRKWLPALGLEGNVPPVTLDPLRDTDASMICFPWMVSGMGMLQDHGTKLHGWNIEDYYFSEVANGGRGALMYQFVESVRAHMLAEVGAEPNSDPDKRHIIDGIVYYQGGDAGPLETRSKTMTLPVKPKRQIVFVSSTSADRERRISFPAFANAAAEIYRDKGWEVIEVPRVHDLSPAEQVYLASETTIWVMATGGASAICTFMPRGASVLLYHGDMRFGQKGHAYLDWDIFA